MTGFGDVRMTERSGEGGALQRGQGLAAWRQIADALESEIGSGALATGAQLPTEALLARRFGVNRHTVRRALADLAGRGLVRASRGRGTFVESRPFPYRIGPRTRFSENVARAGRESAGELLDWRESTADTEIAAALGIEPDSPVLLLETRHRADGAAVSTARAWFPLPRFAGFALRYAETGSITRALESFGVADYLRRSTRITARVASGEEAVLLDLAPGRVVMVADSVNVDGGNVPIQATRAVFAADRVEFAVEL
jgi:GntR family transcriptional regulator, phosphonate transport system regulatory protein